MEREGFDSIHSGQDFEDLFGKVDNLTPYTTPFSVSDLESVLQGRRYSFQKDALKTAVGRERTLIIPINQRDTTGITASYYITGTETGKLIVIDVIHGSKIYHLTLEDIIDSSFITITPDRVTCKDTSEVYITPYTLDKFLVANGSYLRVSKEFAEAAFNKKMILIPTGKTVSNGYYVVATRVEASDPTLETYIRLQVYIDSSYKTIVLNSKVIAPTSVSCTVGTTELITEKRLKGLMNADTVTITGPKAEVSVNSIDGASFTRNGVQTAMTPNTVYNFTDNGAKRTIAVYDDHRLVLTSEGEVEFEYPITYTSSERVLPSALPSSLVTQPELRTAIEEATPDWYSDGGAGFIKNRTHYFKSITSFAPEQRFTVLAGQNGLVSAIDDAKFYFRGELYDLPKIIGEEFSYPSETNKVISVVLQNISEISQFVNYQYTTGVHGGLTQEELPLRVVGPLKRLSKIYLPEDVVYEDELPQSDWNESDDTKPTYVNNRTHFAGLKGVFNIGDRYSLVANTGTHSPESYRLRYKGELYKLPSVGETSFIPNEAEAIFSIRLTEGSSGSNTTYTIWSEAIDLAEGEESLVEVVSAKTSKKLDDFYLPDNVAYNDKLKTINSKSIVGSGDIKLVTKEEWDNKGYSYETFKITSAGEYQINPPSGGLNEFCVVFNQKTYFLVEYVRTQVWSGPPVYVTLKHPDENYYLEVEDSSGYLSEYPLLYVREATPFPSVLIPTELLPQSDWTETNESSSTFIKNKSHYWKPLGPSTSELNLTESTIGSNISSVSDDYFMLYESVYHTPEIIGKDIEIQRWGPSLILRVVEEDGTHYLKHISGTSYPGPTIRLNAYVSVKTIDEVYIPDTIARMRDLENIVPKKQAGSEVPDKLLPNVFYEFSNINSLVLPPLEGDSKDKQNKWVVSAVLSGVDALSIPYKVQWANGDKPQFAEYSILEMTFYKTATGVIYGEWKAFENKFLDVYPKEAMWIPNEDDGSLDINFEVKSNTDWVIK